MTRRIDPEQVALLDRAHRLLSDFDARHDPMLRDALRAVEDFLALVRGAVMGLGGHPDLDRFPGPDQWLTLAHKRLDKHITEAFTDAYLSVLDRATGASEGADLVHIEPFIAHHIETVDDRLRDWPAGVFEEIRDELHASVAAGESVDQLRDRIGAVLSIDAPSREIRARIAKLNTQIQAADRDTAKALRAKRNALYAGLRDTDYSWQWRASRIARTELTAAVNGGTFNAHVAESAAAGTTLTKQWLATSDERTRHTHAAANGQHRPLTAPFDIGGAHLMFPGDPSGPAGETINCRCTILVLPEGSDPLELGPIGDTGPDPLTAAAPEGHDMTTAPATITEDPPAAASRPLPDGWRGPLAPLDRPSGDGRIITSPKDGQLQVRPLPVPLLAQEQLADGHDGAVVVGLIHRAWIQDGTLWGEGPLDLADERGAQWARRMGDGYAGWVSVDLDAVEMKEMLYRAEDGALTEFELIEDPEAKAMGLDGVFSEPDVPEGHELVMAALRWRLMSSTLVSQPAFHEGARVAPLWGYTGPGTGEPMTAAHAATEAYGFPPPKDGPPPKDPGQDGTKAPWVPAVGDRVLVDDPAAGGPGEVTDVDTSVDPVMVTVQLDAGGPVTVEAAKVSPEAPPAGQDGGPRSSAQVVRQLTAAATPRAPDPAWFADPRLTGPTRIQITDDGRVFGHLAEWGVCHIGIPDVCTVAPRSTTGYALFHTGEVLCADGSLVPVGKITVGTGHADGTLGFRAAAEHYDNTGAVAAVVRAYEDSHGIAVAGALVEEATPQQIAAMRRSPLSGDWRRVGGNLELVAALCVVVPGFPVRPALAASVGPEGQQLSLVAAGIVAGAGPAARPSTALSEAIAQALAEQDRNRRRAAAVAARITAPQTPPWARTRAALAAARIHGTDPELAAKAAAGAGYTGKD